MANGFLWSPRNSNITFFGLKWKLRTLAKCYITKILPKSLPISQDKVKCPKILDFTKWKFAICTPKSDVGHTANVNKPNGITLTRPALVITCQEPNQTHPGWHCNWSDWQFLGQHFDLLRKNHNVLVKWRLYLPLFHCGDY